jgi:hypothetical protein
MAADRRKSDSEKKTDRRAADRRASNDRRSGGRRNVDGSKAIDAAENAADKKGKGRPEAGRLMKLATSLALVFSLLIVVVTLSLIYFFANFDYYMNKVGTHISIENSKATIDAESLTGRFTKARMMINIRNDLPFNVILQNLNFNVKMSDYIIAKGVQVMPRVGIDSGKTRIVPVQFQVDSIMTRRGLQKAVEKNTGPILKSLLSRLQGKNDALTENLSGIMTSVGSAELRLVVGGIEIPFSRRFDFNQGS